MKLLLTSYVFFVGALVFGQNRSEQIQALENLKRIIRQSTYNDSAAVFFNGEKAIKLAKKLNRHHDEGKIYQYYGNFYYFSSNPKKAKEYYQKTIDFGIKYGIPELINSTKIRLAFILSESNKDKADTLFLVLLTEALKYNYPKNAIEAYNGIGSIYEDRKIKDQALDFYLKGLQIAEKNNFDYLKGMLLNNIGLLKLANNQDKEALKDFEKALIYAKNAQEYRLIFNLQNNLGLINKKLNLTEKSIEYYTKNKMYAFKLGFPTAKGVTLLNLSDSYISGGMYQEAEKNINESLVYLKQSNNYNLLQNAYLIKSKITTHAKNYKLSQLMIDSCLYYQKFFYDPNITAMAHLQFSEIYELQHKYQLSLEYFKSYHRIQDSLLSVSNIENFTQLQVLYDKENDQKKIATQKSANILLIKDNEIKRTNLQVTVIVAISLLLLIGGIFILRYSIKSKKQQRLFSQKLIETLDQERSRISKDIHDDLGQILSVIKSKNHLQSTRKLDVLDSIDADLAEAINLTRNISHSLHPYYISKIGLKKSIITLLQKIQTSSDLICSYTIDDEIEMYTLDQKTQIYHITQECITNTIKHAHAKSLKITIQVVSNGFFIEYRDNGIGIQNDATNEQGIGLMTIKERTILLSPNTSINYQTKNGFCLTIKENLITKIQK